MASYWTHFAIYFHKDDTLVNIFSNMFYLTQPAVLRADKKLDNVFVIPHTELPPYWILLKYDKLFKREQVTNTQTK